jgi:mono/diheme cytochrome c family protein
MRNFCHRVIQGKPERRAALTMMVSATLSLLPLLVHAQNPGPAASGSALSQGFAFVEMSGEELFAGICQGCHMSDAGGATGAATYPSLANNARLAASGYPVSVVVNGQRGMPALGVMMSDDQVAAVVNYLRSHFGNDYQDVVTAEDVRTVRR